MLSYHRWEGLASSLTEKVVSRRRKHNLTVTHRSESLSDHSLSSRAGDADGRAANEVEGDLCLGHGSIVHAPTDKTSPESMII